MNVHKNARLTRRGRERIVRQVDSGQTLEAVDAQVKFRQLTQERNKPRPRRRVFSTVAARSSHGRMAHLQAMRELRRW